MITPIQVKENKEVKYLIATADRQLKEMGYTEHSLRHLTHVSKAASKTLLELGYSSREAELAEIAGYLHDIGNAINRMDHAHSSAIMAYEILLRMGMSYSETCEVMLAVGNHDENSGTAVSTISAALILADKSDVHRSRVQNTDFSTFDIHDRVNYSVEKSTVTLLEEKREIILELKIDTQFSAVMDYFEIFLGRMLLCRRAANYLDLKFKLIINSVELL